MPKLGTHLTINCSSTLFPSSARIELLQKNIKLTIPKDYQTTLDNLVTTKVLLELTATYIQTPIKTTTFDPIAEFPDVFLERISDELLLLREPNIYH